MNNPWFLRPLAALLCLLTPAVYLFLILGFFMVKVTDWHATGWDDVFLTAGIPIKEVWVFAFTGK